MFTVFCIIGIGLLFVWLVPKSFKVFVFILVLIGVCVEGYFQYQNYQNEDVPFGQVDYGDFNQ